MFKHNHRRGLGKLVLAGSLVAALSIPAAGAAMAAPATTAPYNLTSNGYVTVYAVSNPAQIDWSQLASQYGFDLNSLVQQIQKNLASGGAGTVTVPATTGGSGLPTGTGHTGTSAGSSSAGGSSAGASHAGTSAGSATGSGTSAGTVHSGTGTGKTAGSGSTAGTSHTGTSAGASASSGSTATQSSYASQVVSLVNQERAKAGLKPLKTDSKLTSVAVAKAKDMYANNYFDHNSPTYGSPFDMMKQFGVSYSYAGENIAKGQQNPQAVMNAWMNSSGHRANILNANYSSIGVAYYNGEWVQEFTG